MKTQIINNKKTVIIREKYLFKINTDSITITITGHGTYTFKKYDITPSKENGYKQGFNLFDAHSIKTKKLLPDIIVYSCFLPASKNKRGVKGYFY